MTILHTLKNRRSIHTFKKINIPSDILKDIFTYASYAPTHYMTEPWELIVYQDEGKSSFIQSILSSYKRIGMIKPNNEPKAVKMKESMRDFLMDIPHHVLIYFDRKQDQIRYEEEYAAVCAFIQNAQLAAWEYEVGMLWTITPYMHDPLFARDIGLGENVKIAAVLQVGYPKSIPRNKGRTPIEQKIKFITE
ncbi:nitroreductase [Virgibacillus halodenitrificans]|uniref:nitroreductase family protein n=1 Tax=Virgibacillus halodenitrificans TaxID=1482 RepID=UPI001FB3B471|nr:nitroreductase [Virgibacillus halodenitrificans]MCJ0932655.1 nitroreductase [Virgibacillus halodenitrificans]WHX26809.1 nitroreductase [Virgibacillus halodenitrificans]